MSIALGWPGSSSALPPDRSVRQVRGCGLVGFPKDDSRTADCQRSPCPGVSTWIGVRDPSYITPSRSDVVPYSFLNGATSSQGPKHNQWVETAHSIKRS